MRSLLGALPQESGNSHPRSVTESRGVGIARRPSRLKLNMVSLLCVPLRNPLRSFAFWFCKPLIKRKVTQSYAKVVEFPARRPAATPTRRGSVTPVRGESSSNPVTELPAYPNFKSEEIMKRKHHKSLTALTF